MKMKQIRFFVLHPKCYDVDSALHYLFLEDLKAKFHFIWDSSTPDYVIVSEVIYNNRHFFEKYLSLTINNPIQIMWAGEAIEPDFNIFDYATAFSSTLSNSDRFTQFPSCFVWSERRGFIKTFENTIESIEQAKNELSRKKCFCNFLYSNYKAHPNRDKLFYILSKYKSVDSLGKHLNNVDKKGTGYLGHMMDCIDIKNAYKFSISSENAQVAGYTSEKILTSLCAHTIPIYWGDPDIELNINPKCFINCNKFDHLDDIIQIVKSIDEDDEKWCEMISAPWRTPEQVSYHNKRMTDYMLFFVNIFSQDKIKARRRGAGTWPDFYSESFKRLKQPRYQRFIFAYRFLKYKVKCLRMK